MHPNYEAELARIRAGVPLVVLPVGARVRVTAPGAFFGQVGVVVERGRTSYHLRTPQGRLRVLFAAAEPA